MGAVFFTLTNSGTPAEMAEINAFNDGLRDNGQIAHFNLAWASHSGLDRATGTLVLDRDLFARNTIGHRLAGHAYAYRARPGRALARAAARDDHVS